MSAHGLSTTKWRESSGLLQVGAHWGYWLALVMTAGLAWAVRS